MRTVNVHMLSSKEANPVTIPFQLLKSKLIKHAAGGEFRRLNLGGAVPQHLYFISDEEIKEGDLCYHHRLKIVEQAETVEYGDLVNHTVRGYHSKIVATTDPALHWNQREPKDWKIGEPIKDRIIPSVPESFILKYIEMFNAGIPITQVQLETEYISDPITGTEGSVVDFNYITQLKLRSDNTVVCHPIKEYSFTLEQAVKIFQDGRNAANYQVVDIESFILNKYSNAVLNPQ